MTVYVVWDYDYDDGHIILGIYREKVKAERFCLRKRRSVRQEDREFIRIQKYRVR